MLLNITIYLHPPYKSLENTQYILYSSPMHACTCLNIAINNIIHFFHLETNIKCTYINVLILVLQIYFKTLKVFFGECCKKLIMFSFHTIQICKLLDFDSAILILNKLLVKLYFFYFRHLYFIYLLHL